MYLEAYSRHCGASLTNKVEMTTQVCADDFTPPLPNEPPRRPQACMTWKTVSLGYADPALYAAKRRFDAEQSVNQFKDLAGSMKNLMRPAIDVAEVTSDMDALVRLNACVGPGLRRFQENLVLFSMGKQPLLLPGASPVTPSTQPPGVLADSDYNRLVEDLVADQAKAWSFNRYVPGSTSLGIVAHDPRGQPAQIRAKYFFTSLAKPARTQGSVIVSFTDGMPACIYFSDAPSTCQTPNRRIVSKYSSGGYVDQKAVQAKAQAEASEGMVVCIPDDLFADWKNPPPGSKMVAFQRRLRADSFFVGHSEVHDESTSITLNSGIFPTWNPTGPFNGVIKITDGTGCAGAHREFLALKP